MSTKPKLTLERWAALDPVTYAPESYTYPTLMRMEERCRLHEKAAPRLLAALRGLAAKYDGACCVRHAKHSTECSVCGFVAGVEKLSVELRALIEQTDLAAPEQAQ